MSSLRSLVASARSSLALVLLAPLAAQQPGQFPAAHSGWLNAQIATPHRDLNVPPPPRVIQGELSKNGGPPVPLGTGTLPQPDSLPSATVLPNTTAPTAGQFTFFYNVDSLSTGASVLTITEPTVALNRLGRDLDAREILTPGETGEVPPPIVTAPATAPVVPSQPVAASANGGDEQPPRDGRQDAAA